LKDVEQEPWREVAVDLSGPWKAEVDNKEVIFHTLTIMDTFTGWVEIIPILSKHGDYISDIFEREWLRRYPKPFRVIYDRGSEFDSKEFTTRLIAYYIKAKPITVKNPQANAIIERMHRVMGDLLRVQLVTRNPRDQPIQDMTSAAAFALRGTVHSVTKYSPAQLAFNRDLILRTGVLADIEMARLRKEKAIQINNQ